MVAQHKNSRPSNTLWGKDLRGRKPLPGSSRVIFRARLFSQPVGPVKAPLELVLGLSAEDAEKHWNQKGGKREGTHRDWSFLCSSRLCRGRPSSTSETQQKEQRSSRLVGEPSRLVGKPPPWVQKRKMNSQWEIFNTQGSIPMKCYFVINPVILFSLAFLLSLSLSSPPSSTEMKKKKL